MADPQTSKQPRQEEEDGEGESEEELILELKQMVQVIRNHRSAVGVEFKNNFASLLAAQRPLLFTPAESTDEGNNAESSEETQLADEDPEIADKTRLLKHKISSLASALPSLLKRANDCISMIDKLDTYNVTIHPAFKKKRL